MLMYSRNNRIYVIIYSGIKKKMFTIFLAKLKLQAVSVLCKHELKRKKWFCVNEKSKFSLYVSIVGLIFPSENVTLHHFLNINIVHMVANHHEDRVPFLVELVW